MYYFLVVALVRYLSLQQLPMWIHKSERHSSCGCIRFTGYCHGKMDECLNLGNWESANIPSLYIMVSALGNGKVHIPPDMIYIKTPYLLYFWKGKTHCWQPQRDY